MLRAMFEVEVDGNNVYTKDRLKYGFERVVLTLKGWKIPPGYPSPLVGCWVVALRLLSRYRNDRLCDKYILHCIQIAFSFSRIITSSPRFVDGWSKATSSVRGFCR